MSRVFQKVGVPKVGKSVFNLSYEKKFVCAMGQLIPSMVDEVVPGDVFDISKRIVARFLPLAAPLMHTVYLYEYTFFVPYRLLMTTALGDSGDFEDMMKGGSDGDTDITIPTWQPTTYTVGSLWDFMGFPIGIDPTGAYPVDFPKRAYMMIYNEYFRDQEIDSELNITTSEGVINVRWGKDYFTSAREDEQRGTSPGLPISGTIDVDPQDAIITIKNATDATARNLYFDSVAGNIKGQTAPSGADTLRWVDPQLEVDLSGATTIDINDLRLAVQTQKWMERNMRAGTRYTELLRAHFGVAPRDERLDRPEFIGSIKSPMILSEVIQTAEGAATPTGELVGHGLGLAEKHIGKYRVKEYGLIMSVLFVRPRTSYSQGIDRQWRKDTLYDFYWPEFANLSEQPVLESEIVASATEANNDTVFGYQGRYNEMRVKRDIVCSWFAKGQTYNYWTLSREWSGRPTLNGTFLSTGSAVTSGGIRKDIFAGDDENSCMISVGNIIKAVRPLPALAMPGYLDHN